MPAGPPRSLRSRIPPRLSGRGSTNPIGGHRLGSPRRGRTRFGSRVAFDGSDENEGADEVIAAHSRKFSLLEIASGLPDASREADERSADRRLRGTRGRLKATGAEISTTSGAGVVLRQDWIRAARFYASHGVADT